MLNFSFRTFSLHSTIWPLESLVYSPKRRQRKLPSTNFQFLTQFFSSELCSPSLATPYLIRGLSQVSSRSLHIGFLSTNIVSIELKKYWFYLNMIFSTKKPLITLLSFTTKVCLSLKQCFGVLNNFCLSKLVFYLIFRLTLVDIS